MTPFFYKKRRKKKLGKRILLLGGLSLILLFVYFNFFGGESGYFQIRKIERKISDYRAQNRSLMKENQRLREEIYRLKNDMSYIEKIAREELGMAKEGEVIYKFVFK